MSSTRKLSERDKNSDREYERKELTLNFTVRGSPVPIYAQRPKTFREYKICRSVSKEPKRKEIPLPMEKIIYLTERLELANLMEKKIKSVSISGVSIKTENSSGKAGEAGEVVWSGENEGNRVELLNDASSPGFDFSLDLSSIANAVDDLDESCSESEETFSDYNGGSSAASPWEKELCETKTVANCSDRSFCESGRGRACEVPERAKTRHCDLVSVYLNSVNKQKELSRFFRPCRTCKERCCVCFDSSSRSALRRSIDSASLFWESARDPSSSFGELNVSNKCFACERADYPILRKRLCCTEFCRREIFETDFCKSFCGKESKCRNCAVSRSASDDTVDSYRMPAYTSTLANAAKSAHILARDLELILNTLYSETD